jgi:hypothetical protein
MNYGFHTLNFLSSLLGIFGTLVLFGGGYGGLTSFMCFGDGAFIDSFF